MSDRDIKTWDSRLKDQNDRGWENYLRRRVYLDVARDLDLWAIAGDGDGRGRKTYHVQAQGNGQEIPGSRAARL